MPFTLPALPYPKDALAPHLSAETLDFHYGRHHKAYVDKLNGLVEGSQKAKRSLEELIQSESGDVFDNAAQAWNHTFYWHCMSPEGGGRPERELAKAIDRGFGGFEEFQKQFKEAATSLFGSGWVWLVRDERGKLSVFKGKDADNPIAHGLQPVFTCDVWEHAYYIDYRNERDGYIDSFFKLANWDFASNRFQEAGRSVVHAVSDAD